MGNYGVRVREIEKEVPCYCTERLFVTIFITITTDKGPPYVEIYDSSVEVLHGYGCEKDPYSGPKGGSVYIETEKVAGKEVLYIKYTAGNTCGKCPPAPVIASPSRGGVDIENPCSYKYGSFIHSQQQICRCVSIGSFPPPPCSCGVMFEIVNAVKYAQKCVLVCNAKTGHCYWQKITPGRGMPPLKPGYIRLPNTKWCRVNNRPWEIKLISDVNQYLDDIKAPKLLGCKNGKLKAKCKKG